MWLLMLCVLLGCQREAPRPVPPALPGVPRALSGCFRLQLGLRSTIRTDDLRNPASRWCYVDFDRRTEHTLLARPWRPGLELGCETPSLDHAGRLSLTVIRPAQILVRQADVERGELQDQEVSLPEERWELSGQMGQEDDDAGGVVPVLTGTARVETKASEGRPGRELAFSFVGRWELELSSDEAARADVQAEQLRLLREPLPPNDLTTRAHSW